MDSLKKYLLQKARAKYKSILPCKADSTFEDCFSVEGEYVHLWFNTEDLSTHIVSCRKEL